MFQKLGKEPNYLKFYSILLQKTFKVMEVVQKFTSPVATWYKYQPVGQMGSVYIKNSKVDTCFSKKVEFYGIKNWPPN